jgi:protein-S-isoprenylcysteine O-methyltransferase Ste14
MAATLLLVAGLWWTAAIFSWAAWERRFMSPDFRRAHLEKREQAGGGPDLLDVLGFGLPMLLPIALALDGLAGTDFVFYNPLLKFPIPFAEAFQILGLAFLSIALPTLTWAAYLTGKYVFSKAPEERTLLTSGPYRLVRHPLYVSFALVGAGFVLLAQNYLMLPVLILFFKWSWRQEEAELERVYGERYTEYRARTGAFLPRIRRRR